MGKPLLGNLEKGLLFVISAPAGTGKTTVVRQLVSELQEYVVQSISCTTRPARPGEVDGKDYFFLTKEEFEEKKARGEFLETVSVFSADYGTLRETVEKHRQMGKHILLAVDTCGAITLKEKEKARLIFLLPPSMTVLKKRLQERKTESKQLLKERLERVDFELEQLRHFDYQIVNDDLEIACQTLKSILIAEEHRLDHVSKELVWQKKD